VVLRLGPFNLPWLKRDSRDDDPYWDFFIRTPPADLANCVPEMIRGATEGNVFPTKADIHTPEITSSHVKELARYLGASLVGIAKLNLPDKSAPPPVDHARDAGIESYPFAVICAVRADYDPRESPGIGGQVPVQNGMFITFVLSAWIRELGFHATVSPDLNSERLAAAAGLGKLNANGRLVCPEYGTGVHVANAICTDLPLAAD
jgi:hypothetical protein